jgi:1-acyl-sn-glycerol-3-phosphate acyltransferase
LLKRDPFGHLIFIKKILVSLIGFITYSKFNRRNKITIKGSEQLLDLPKTSVLFVSNHQTYFADVIALLHVFGAIKNKPITDITHPYYLFKPRVNTYFIAAQETMKDGLIPRIFAYVGSISIKRTFREGGQDINRKVELKDITNIGTALNDGWVITFPQGTTKPFAKGRRGTAHIIKKYQPVVVPVVIEGFNKAFDKKGFHNKRKGVDLKIQFKAPLHFSYNEDADTMISQIMDAIEQSEKYTVTKAEKVLI